MAPPQALGREQLVDAAPLDRDAPLLVEVGLQPVERPAAEGQTEVLGGRQCGGDHLGALLGGVGMGSPGAGTVLEPGESGVVEAMEPGVDGRARQPQATGHGGR
jgi:hypothetical protein